MPETGPEVRNRGAVVPNHQGRKVRKEERCSKDWKKVYFIGWETRRRMWGNLGERQAAGNINDGTMAKDSKAKDHSNFLLGISNFFPNSRGRRRDGSKFRPEIKNQLIPASTPLVGFSGEIIWPLGQISLLVRIGDEEHSTSAWMNFMVVRSPSPYNGIIGRPGVINNTPINNCEVEGVTTRGRKTTTQDTQNNNDGIHTEEPHTTNHDKPVESDEVLTNDQPQEASEPLAQPSNKTQTPIPFPQRLRK
nr:reverse transcriptase domain-containing protein [Tanacetum cinerariifolium]